jgi:hypothetical protein
MIDPRDDKPDRSAFHKDTSPSVLLYQLNENWRQLRLVRRAVADRDDIIGQLHEAIRARDRMITAQTAALKLRNWLRPLGYALVGGVTGEIVKFALGRVFR